MPYTPPSITLRPTPLDQTMQKHYQAASFELSAPTLKHCPPDTGMEVAFAGRSNAGKSSAINALTSQRSLARTSKTPGRTQHMVFFRFDPDRALVDLPGYGFAKVSENMRYEWQRHLSDYLAERQALRGLILLVDARRGIGDYDERLLELAAFAQLPVHVLLTKADKLKKGPASAALLSARKHLGKVHPGATAQLFSSLKRQGLDQAWKQLDQWFEIAD